MNEQLKKAYDFLCQRRRAYRLTFNKEDRADQEVLRDLAKFCFSTKTTFNVDERKQTLAEGRREVWLRISQHLNLTEEELWELLK